jgi:HPt (histidine-containing phosphotransfer) domain-containing protein
MNFDEEKYIRELSMSYLKDLLKEVIDLEQSISSRDASRVKFFGHRMKGTAGTLGLEEIYALGNQMEEEAKTNNWDNIKILQAKLRTAIQQRQI